MRTSNGIRLSVYIVMATALVAWIGPYDNLTHTPAISMNGSGSSATKTFTVTAPPLAANGNSSDPSQRYKVFFFAGDGSYVLDEVLADDAFSGASWTYSHTYPDGTATYPPYVEMTDIYDDNTNPPGRAAAPPFSTGIGSGGSSQPANLGGFTATITPVRKMVTDHALTYIVTYENPNITSNPCEAISGNVVFTFDASKIQYTGYETYPGAAVVDATNATTGTLLIPFTNLAKGQQKNTFLKFTTTGLYQQTVAPPSARMQISSGSEGCDYSQINTRVFTLSEHNTIESAHDPNRKSVWLEQVGTQQFLVYLIEFQNDGADTVKNVTITDELDIKLKGCVLNDAYLTFKPNRGQKQPPTFLSNGIINIEWQNVNLPGLGQPDYGSAFGEPETKGSVKIRIPLETGCPNAYKPCDAFLNRASIRFDCNPPIETNLTIFNLNCAGRWAVTDTHTSATTIPATMACADTLHSIDTVTAVVGGFQLLDTATESFFANGGFICQWYPESGLGNATMVNPNVTEYKNRTYTMVASKSCERYILHRTVVVPCAITLSASVQPVGANYDVTLTVANPSGNPLQWQDCSQVTTNPMTISNLVPGKYYFSVYDQQTGCYAEQWVTLCGNQPTVADTPGDCIADLQVSGGNPPYSFQWEWNGQQRTYNSQTLSLNWKSNVQVTVTDSNGCSTVFQPVPGNCNWWNVWWLWGTVAALAIVFLAKAVVSIFKKK